MSKDSSKPKAPIPVKSPLIGAKVKKPNTAINKYSYLLAVPAVVFSYLASNIVFYTAIGLVLYAWAAVMGGSVDALINTVDQSSIFRFISTSLVYVVMFGLTYGIMRLLHISLKDVGFLNRKPKFDDVGWAIIAFVGYFILVAIVSAFVAVFIPSVDMNQEQQLGFDKSSTGLILIPIFIALVIVPPIVEEFVMRGFLWTGLRTRVPIWLAAIITSFVFSIGHLQLGEGAPPLYTAAIDTFTLSLFLIYVRVKTGSLWASMFVHGIKNSLAFIYLFIIR